MAAVVAEKIIRIDVIASANAQRTINAMASDMKKVETAAANMQRTMSTGFGGINSILGKVTGFLGAFGVTAGMGAVTQWVIDAASSWQVLESRLTLVLGSTEKARRATVDIADIAKLTGREIDGVAKLYEKASRSAQQFGISEDQVKQITLGFSQSIRLSGASTQEAYAALVQFGQALASGRLQGDEFRSLMENNAVFMYEFAKAAGLTVAQLRKMGTEGKLSAKFLFDTMAKEGADALNMMERLNKMAKEVPLTFRQSFTAINSAATEFVGTFTLLFSSKSGDQYGVFGNWIRGLTAMTDRLRDLKIISDALGEGFWARLARLYKSESALAGGTDSVAGAAAAALGLTSGRRDTLLDSLKAEREGKLKEIQRLGAGVAREEKFFTQAFGPEKSSYPAGSKEQARLEILNERRDQLNALLETYQRLRIEERKLEYGEGFYGDPKVDNKEPDPDAERRLKTARSSLEDFAKARQRDADATWDILLGREEEKKAAREMAMLQEKLTEALVKGDSAQANAIRTDIRRAELGRKLIDELEDEAKAREKVRDAEKTELEKVQTQTLRDTEALEALVNKTKATDEYTEAKLRMLRADAVEERLALAQQELPDFARLEYLNALIPALEKAANAKRDFMDARLDAKQREDQRIVDAANDKRVGDMADTLNTSIKKGILDAGDGKSVGEALRENIIDSVQNMTVDIILNPVTTVFSRMLAQLADQFSLMLTKSLYESIASESKDPIGMLFTLFGWGMSGNTGGTAISGPGLQVPPGFGFPQADGLAYVPYDDYPARLHRGERVLTANENARYAQGSVNINSNPVITIDSRTDQAVVYGIVVDAVQRGNQALVEEMRSQGVIG